MAEPTPDLAVIVANLKRVTDGGSWAAIDRQSTELVVAALERQAELEGALRALVEEAEGMNSRIWNEWGISSDPGYGEDTEAIKKAKALLARSVQVRPPRRGEWFKGPSGSPVRAVMNFKRSYPILGTALAADPLPAEAATICVSCGSAVPVGSQCPKCGLWPPPDPQSAEAGGEARS